MSDLPDIEFINTEPETTLNRMIARYEGMADKKLYPADPVRLLISFMAGIAVQFKVEINETAKKNVTRYASGEYLDSLGELFYDIRRKEPEAASVTLRFTISAPQETSLLIPKDTAVTVDGEINFLTAENIYIKPGETYADVGAVCDIPGIIGNSFTAGQISKIVTPFPFFESVVNITESAGGANSETDPEMRRHLSESKEAPSTAGSAGGYIYHAKAASSQIADVKASSEKDGVASLRVLCKNGKLPSDELLKLIEKAVSADKVRPLTDKVEISAPDIVPFNIKLTYYINKEKSSDAAAIQTAVSNAADSFASWQTGKIGRDINPSYLISLIINAGACRVEVSEPEYLKISENQVAVLRGTPVIINGGIEDE